MAGVDEGAGWSGFHWLAWGDYAQVRARLDAGADPDPAGSGRGAPLFAAAERGSPEVVTELAGRVQDIDAECEGRTALWLAVYRRRPDNAHALAAAGADPWRPMMAGWSPGRLSLASPTPDLFTAPPGGSGLSTAEADAAAEGRRVTTALGDLWCEGGSVACVAGIDTAEAARRLAATPVEDTGPGSLVDEALSHRINAENDLIIGATDVPGGCVLAQPWGYAPQMPGVTTRLSTGTVCYAVFANPKSGNQGSITRDGVIEGSDLHPAGEPNADDPADEVLAAFLYQHSAEAYACAYVGLRPTDARPITGPPDTWLRLPARDYWH